MLSYANAMTIEILALKLLRKTSLTNQIVWFFDQQKSKKKVTIIKLTKKKT